MAAVIDLTAARANRRPQSRDAAVARHPSSIRERPEWDALARVLSAVEAEEQAFEDGAPVLTVVE